MLGSKRLSKFFNENNKEKLNPTEQSLEKRQIELRLISKVAGENYNKELQKNGLVIIESFYGEDSLIRELASYEDKLKFLHDHAAERNKLFDVTISMRFLVTKHSKLDIGNKKKNTILGFPDMEANMKKTIYIK